MDRRERKIRRLRRAKIAMVVVSGILAVVMAFTVFVGVCFTDPFSGTLGVGATRGGVWVFWMPDGIPTLLMKNLAGSHPPHLDITPDTRWGDIHGISGTRFFGASLPLIYPLAGCLAGVWFIHRHERQLIRNRLRLCPQCSYDLRGSTGTVCPECGTPKSGEAKGVIA